MSALPPVITVDGPSGVGKGMVTRWLAARTGWHRLDSGALYRLLALAAIDRRIDLAASETVAALAGTLVIRFAGSTEEDEAILLDERDRTAEVRAEATGALASQIAAAPAVRAALLQRQRDFRVAPGLIADGRDMGTVVFPDAALKIFIEASPLERARRRLAQLSKRGVSAKLQDLFDEIDRRDARDRTRSVAPLVPAADAVVIDTTTLRPSEVVAEVGRLLEQSALDCSTARPKS